jgi:hypothetical protein
VCQLCKKTGHTVLRCWKRFERNYTGEERVANSAEGHGYNVDPAWYLDMGAIDHVTNEFDKLAVRERYTEQEQIHIANGGSMQITHIVKSTLHTPSHDLILKNVLYVPSSCKNLVSIHCFIRDNHVFVEYHPYFFLVKDPATRRILLHSKCEGGLYPFPALEHSTTRCVLSTVRSSLKHWHQHLSHPSSVIIQRVLGDNKLAFSKESSSDVVCDVGQCGKSHQLMFPRSISVSKDTCVGSCPNFGWKE